MNNKITTRGGQACTTSQSIHVSEETTAYTEGKRERESQGIRRFHFIYSPTNSPSPLQASLYVLLIPTYDALPVGPISRVSSPFCWFVSVASSRRRRAMRRT